MNARDRSSGRLVGWALVGVGAVVVGAQEARGDRVRVAANVPGFGLSYHHGHRSGVVAIGHGRCCPASARRIWHEPVYEWRERWVHVPAVIERRRVAVNEPCGRTVYRHVDVVVKPARRVLKRERVIVRAGYYETIHERGCHRGGFGIHVGVGNGPVIIGRRPPELRRHLPIGIGIRTAGHGTCARDVRRR